MGLFKFLKEKFSKKDESNKKYNESLSKTRTAFSNKLGKLASKCKLVNEEYFEDLEEILVEADCGVSFTLEVIDYLLNKSKKEKIDNPKDINELLIEHMMEKYGSYEEKDLEIKFSNKPEVLLVVGVNGVGKTTTIAKLANHYTKTGKKVLLVSADTFRAGAIEQLDIWAQRIGCEIYKGKQNEDPSSVAYDGVSKGIKESYDLVIVDTAGRLQNKQGLMDELGKINRVIGKIISYPIETFLIIDATTGQNGISQAKAFKDLIGLSGIIITKLDGTSKGGSVLTIKEQLGVPVRFIGFGESIDDIEVFNCEKFIYGLCEGLMNND